MGIPFERLGIPAPFRKSVAPSAPRTAKIAVAKGLIPCTADVQLALLYVLAVDKDRVVAKAARATMKDMPVPQVLSGISQSTFPKVLEFIAQFRPDSELDARLLQLRSTPDRAAELVAARAGKDLCEALVRNQERLLMTPSVFVHLHANPNCDEEALQNAESFLRMHNSLPKTSARRPFETEKEAKEAAQEAAPVAQNKPAGNPLDDLFDDDPMPSEARDEPQEVEPAPAPVQPEIVPEIPAAPEPDLDMFNLDAVKTDSTDLGAFSFNFDDDMEDFSWDLTREPEGEEAAAEQKEEEVKLSLEQKLREMSVGKKIKLAYMGNQEARKILVRDPNKIVAAAVVKSGRLTPNEVASFAGNKNLHDEVVRLIAQNKEFVRKYPVQVALVNNPKCPVPLALKLMQNLQKRDLQSLANNKNVPSAIFGLALKMYKEKYRK
jgi:hypothetical protein